MPVSILGTSIPSSRAVAVVSRSRRPSESFLAQIDAGSHQYPNARRHCGVLDQQRALIVRPQQRFADKRRCLNVRSQTKMKGCKQQFAFRSHWQGCSKHHCGHLTMCVQVCRHHQRPLPSAALPQRTGPYHYSEIHCDITAGSGYELVLI